VFADVDPRTFNLDPDAAEAAITPRTKAIMPVHQIGMPADIDRFLALGDKYGVKIYEDCACAIGSRYKGRPIGGHTELACFSLHPRKIITTGDGGVITTNNSADTARHGAAKVIIETYDEVGYNYRLTDVQAAIGIEQVKRLDWIVQRRRELAHAYNAALADHPWLKTPYEPDWAHSNYQSYAVTLTENAPCSRNELMQHLLERGIATRRGIMLAHREKPFLHGPNAASLKQSERASDDSILLPLYPDLSAADLGAVVAALCHISALKEDAC
jgi:dTDP-4-amino-4,6-dideoxygalactose transaminase